MNVFGADIKTSSISVGIWLFIAYITLLTIVVGTLNAYHFQSAVEHTASKPGVFREIVGDAQRLYELDNRLARTKSAIDTKRQQIGILKEAEWQALSEGTADNTAPVPSSNIKNTKIDFLNTEVIRLEKVRTLVEGEIGTLLQDPEKAALIGELHFLNQINLGILAILPNMILTLILTLAMGGLGSLIYVTYDFFHMKYGRHEESGNRKHTLTWYLFRPLLGMVTALAVFVLFKAGHLSLSVSSGNGGDIQTMSPFFVSFIGIISGLMTEQATDKIRHTGTALFRSGKQRENDRHRWAVGVQRAITEKNMDSRDLMSYLDVPDKTVADWLEQKKPVPPAEQMVISAWLALPKQILFTDIRPKTS